MKNQGMAKLIKKYFNSNEQFYSPQPFVLAGQSAVKSFFLNSERKAS